MPSLETGPDTRSSQVCFVTLAVGRSYRSLALTLAADLATFAPDIPLVVLTDRPGEFAQASNVIAHRHRMRSILGYNDKLCAVSRGLRDHETCIFLDADVRILRPFDAHNFKPSVGFRAFRIRTWEYTRQEALTGEPRGWKSENLRIMQLLRERYRLQQSDADLRYVVEYLFCLTRGPGLDAFLRKWNELAEYCERQSFLIHEGFSMGLAAELTGFPLTEYRFPELKFFKYRLRPQDLDPRLWSPGEFESLKASVTTARNAANHPRLLGPVVRLARDAGIRFRQAKVRLMGLSLLD